MVSLGFVRRILAEFGFGEEDGEVVEVGGGNGGRGKPTPQWPSQRTSHFDGSP